MITQKQILDMCGNGSFKRGEAFHRSGKVKIEQYTGTHCQAIVAGTENFYVTIDDDGEGGIRTECSCPSLPFYPHKCQHVAAVMHAISGLDEPSVTDRSTIPFQ